MYWSPRDSQIRWAMIWVNSNVKETPLADVTYSPLLAATCWLLVLHPGKSAAGRLWTQQILHEALFKEREHLECFGLFLYIQNIFKRKTEKRQCSRKGFAMQCLKIHPLERECRRFLAHTQPLSWGKRPLTLMMLPHV